MKLVSLYLANILKLYIRNSENKHTCSLVRTFKQPVSFSKLVYGHDGNCLLVKSLSFCTFPGIAFPEK